VGTKKGEERLGEGADNSKAKAGGGGGCVEKIE
jgi:hypothetical protein